jgi:hypothetical protein
MVVAFEFTLIWTVVCTKGSLQVPAVWCHSKGRLNIKVLQHGDYVEVSASPTFPGWPLIEKIPEFMALGQQQVMSQVIRQFRQWVRERLSPWSCAILHQQS